VFKSLATGFLTFWSLFSGCPYPNSDCNDCNDFHYKIKYIGKLPEAIKESSGLARMNDLFLTHGDSGNGSVIYGFKYPFDNDSISSTVPIHEASNRDWEELAQDDGNSLFIGDFGNNLNNRSDLKIFKYNYYNQETEVLTFEYANQSQFPPKKLKHQIYDCEAMFWKEGRLYLLSKNKSTKQKYLYAVDEKFEHQEIEPHDSIALKNTFITSADISPDQSEVALLSYGKVLFMDVRENTEGQIILEPGSCKRFGRSGQAEAVMYLDNDHLLITNEKGKAFLLYRKYNGTSSKELESPENILLNIIEKD